MYSGLKKTVELCNEEVNFTEDVENASLLLGEPSISTSFSTCQPTSKSTSKPTSNAIISQSIGKRIKPRDVISEQTLNYLDKKNKTVDQKSDEDSFALSIIPSLKRMADQQKALAKLRIQQTLYEIEFGTESVCQ